MALPEEVLQVPDKSARVKQRKVCRKRSHVASGSSASTGCDGYTCQSALWNLGSRDVAVVETEAVLRD
jgi:hypothetical protein